MKNTREEIKVGTKIAESIGGWGNYGYNILEIVRETPKQWVDSKGNKYRKDDLKRIGGYGRLTICTDEHLRLNKEYSLKNKIGSLLYDMNNKRNRTSTKDVEVLGRLYGRLLEIQKELFGENEG